MTNLNATRAVLLNNLYRFNKDVLQADNPTSQLCEKPHLELCRVVENWDNKNRKLVLMPRSTFKSSVVTVGYAIQQICKNPNIRILIGSEVNALAKAFLREIKTAFETNDRLKYLYGDHVRTYSRWTDDGITSAKRTRNFKEHTVFTSGIDQTRTGLHANLIIIDDPISRENINTKEMREKTIDWYRELSNNILDPGPNNHMIIVGTRWHFADLYQYILDEEVERYDVIRKQAMTDEAYRIMASGKSLDAKKRLIEDDQLLFPERLDVGELWNKFKSSGRQMFNNQYMNRVIDSEDASFRERDIRWYEPGTRFVGLNKYMTVDPAISEKESGDFSAIMCVGVDAENNWWVLDYDNFKGKPQELMDRVFKMFKLHPEVRRIGIETVAFQKSLIYAFRDEERKRQVKLPMTEIARGGRGSLHKEARIEGILNPVISQRRLHMQKGMIELREQLRTFPRSRHDDLLDSLADIGQVMGGYRTGKNMGKETMTREERDDLEAERERTQTGRSKFTKY